MLKRSSKINELYLIHENEWKGFSNPRDVTEVNAKFE